MCTVNVTAAPNPRFPEERAALRQAQLAPEEKEAARQAIDEYLRHRLPEAPQMQVQVSDVDAATRAEKTAAYAARFQEERKRCFATGAAATRAAKGGQARD
jgi:hypothetical protein